MFCLNNCSEGIKIQQAFIYEHYTDKKDYTMLIYYVESKNNSC